MRPNDVGQLVEKWWLELASKYSSVELDEYIVMPNHFHGIVCLVGATLRGRPNGGYPVQASNHEETRLADEEGRPHRAAPTLGDVMDWFKTMTTNEYIRGVKNLGWPPFLGRLWQRDYHDRIIRDEDELNRLREYIALNPAHWAEDKNNPANIEL